MSQAYGQPPYQQQGGYYPQGQNPYQNLGGNQPGWNIHNTGGSIFKLCQSFSMSCLSSFPFSDGIIKGSDAFESADLYISEYWFYLTLYIV